MNTKTFTAEEVRIATGADDKNDYEPDILIWAASEYLRAREVIAFYADANGCEIAKDSGQRARDWLGVKNG